VAGGSGVVAADVPGPVRAVRAVPADPGGDPARRRPAVGVLPGGVALQVRQQALHALNMALIFIRASSCVLLAARKRCRPAGDFAQKGTARTKGDLGGGRTGDYY
jgi:hypothetical protein